MPRSLQASGQAHEAAGQKEHYTKAVEAYQKAIAIKPQGAYYNNMAEAMAKMGDTPAAITASSHARSRSTSIRRCPHHISG